MLTVTLAIVAALVVAWLVITFVVPIPFINGLLRLVRRVCGLEMRTIDVGGVTWPYLDGGPRSGEVLLLLHGFGGDKDNWPIYARGLRRDYRVIIPDLPGFGENFRDNRDDYGMAAQAERLHAFVRALSIERFHVAGNSMGGFLALKYALSYPDAVMTLTLLNSAGVTGANASELEVMAERGESPLVVRSEQDFDWLIRFLVHRRLPVPRVFKRYFCNRAIARQAFLDYVFWSLVKEIKASPLNDELPGVVNPTLIIWGRHDRLIDVSCVDTLEAGIPDSRSIVYDDIGHVPMLECPARAAAAHLEHLRRHPGGA